MPKRDKTLKEEIAPLLSEVAVAEASSKVWDQLARATEGLDEQSRVVLGQYFEGTSIRDLSESHHVSVQEMELWIQKIRRQVLQTILSQNRIKN